MRKIHRKREIYQPVKEGTHHKIRREKVRLGTLPFLYNPACNMKILGLRVFFSFYQSVQHVSFCQMPVRREKYSGL